MFLPPNLRYSPEWDSLIVDGFDDLSPVQIAFDNFTGWASS